MYAVNVWFKVEGLWLFRVATCYFGFNLICCNNVMYIFVVCLDITLGWTGVSGLECLC